MRGRAGQAVEPGALLESDGNRGMPRQVDDLLQSRAGGAFSDEDAIERTPGFQAFEYGIDAAEYCHPGSVYCSGSRSRPLLKRLVKLATAATSVSSTICSSLKCWFSAARVLAASAVRVSSRA